jgi:hypothetical protein
MSSKLHHSGERKYIKPMWIQIDPLPSKWVLLKFFQGRHSLVCRVDFELTVPEYGNSGFALSRLRNKDQ